MPHRAEVFRSLPQSHVQLVQPPPAGLYRGVRSVSCGNNVIKVAAAVIYFILFASGQE